MSFKAPFEAILDSVKSLLDICLLGMRWDPFGGPGRKLGRLGRLGQLGQIFSLQNDV